MDQLIKGKSVELNSSKKITPKQAYFLNQLYWDAVEKIPMRQVIKGYPSPQGRFISDSNDIKLWMGRQHGEVLCRKIEVENKYKKKEVVSAKTMAISLIRNHFGVDDDLAIKYLCLNEYGFFDEEKEDDISAHWFRRTGINLANYKELLKGMEIKEAV